MKNDTQLLYVPPRRLFWGVVAIQVTLIVALALLFYSVIWFGKSVWIKTAPLDPYDPYYGYHYNLGYEIEQVPIERYKGKFDIRDPYKLLDSYMDTPLKVNVILKQKPGSPIFDVEGVYLLADEMPDIQGDEVLIKGTLDNVWNQDVINAPGSKYIMRINYNMNTFFISEEMSRKSEDVSGQAWIELRVTPWGKLLNQLSFTEPK